MIIQSDIHQLFTQQLEEHKMENTTFLFALQKISTEQFALNEDVLNLDCNINLSSKFKFGIVPENRILAVSVKFMFEKESNPFIIVEVVCNFDIEQKSWNNNFSSEKKQIVIPNRKLGCWF